MTIFQLLAALFGLFMFYIINIHRKKSQLTPLEVNFWYSIWGLFIIISLFPNLLLGISQKLHFTRVFDLLVVGGMMILTIIVIINYFQQKENNQKLQKFVRQQAIDDALNTAKSGQATSSKKSTHKES